MRWLKHLTSAHDDPAICKMVHQMGAEGYGIYWLILEHIAGGMTRDSKDIPSRQHSLVDWALICCCSPQKLRKFLKISTELKLINSRTLAELKHFASRLPADFVQIEVPNLLKYRDEYSQRSRHSPDNVHAVDGDRDREVDREEESSSCCTETSVGNVGVKAPAAAAPTRLFAEWETDATYAPLVAAWRAAKPDAIDEDFALNHKYWRAFDEGQQEQALGHLCARVAAGLLNSSTLGYWLRVDWKRPVVLNENGHGARAPDRNQKRREEVNKIAKLLRQ